MRVLLIRPDTPKNSINLQSFMICEPLELEYVSASLKLSGHSVDLVDMLIEKTSITDLLRRNRYDMVCFTAYITTVGMVKKYAKEVKSIDNSILTAVGGVHAEVVPDDFKCEDIDYVLWANGVDTLVRIANTYPCVNIDEIEGIYREGRNKPEIINGRLPFPDREITRKYRDKYNYIYHEKCATIKTSFGCPYKCKFCFCTQICDYSAREIEGVLDELESIEEGNVYIVDDNFLVSRERVIAFCEGLDKRSIKKHYIAYARADFISKNEDIIAMLKQHGFDALFVGIESFKKSELFEMSKQSTVEENIKAVRILERNGVQCYSGLIVGEDWDKSDFDTLIEYLNGFEHPMVNIQPITPMPGTPLFNEYKYPITIPRDDFACWDMAHVVYKPIKMSKRKYYYHIVRAYVKTSANKKQRKYIRQKYGKRVYNRVKQGATKIFFQYLRLMIKPR